MPIQFDRFGHDTALEIVYVTAASANREVRIRAINGSDESGVAAKTQSRVGGQAIIAEGFCVSLIIDLSKEGASASNINFQAAAGTDDDLRGRGPIPLHQDFSRHIQHSVAAHVHGLLRVQRETGHQIIVRA